MEQFRGKNSKKVFALSNEINFLSVLVDESTFRLEISLWQIYRPPEKIFSESKQYLLNFFILFSSPFSSVKSFKNDF